MSIQKKFSIEMAQFLFLAALMKLGKPKSEFCVFSSEMFNNNIYVVDEKKWKNLFLELFGIMQ